MRNWMLVLLFTLSGPALADSGMKPGLWEMRVLKNVVDGHDTSAQMSAMSERMKAQMDKLTPEQRAQMSAMMGQHGMSMPMADGGAIQMCISPEMAKRDVPPTGKKDACEPTQVERTGNHITYKLNCTSGRTKTTGTGEWTSTSDKMTSRTDATVVENGATHHVESEMEWKFLKSDCGNVAPAAVPASH